MSYFDDLIEARDNKLPSQLWKLNLNNTEIEILIQVLNEGFDSGHYQHLGREACLLCAVWWNRKYNGGSHQWERILTDMGIAGRHSPKIIALCKQTLLQRQLNLILYRSENKRRMFLESLLVQGGLPMQGITELKENTNVFRQYFLALINEYSDLSIKDWTDISIAKTIAGRWLHSKTFLNNDTFFEFSLEVVKSFFMNDDTFADNKEILNIINWIKEQRGKQRSACQSQFKVNWEFRREGKQIITYYSLSIPSSFELPPHDNETLPNEISYYMNGQLIASYHKQGNKMYLLPGSPELKHRKWDSSKGSLTLQKKTEFDQITSELLINNEAPLLEEPLMLQFKSGYWIIKSDANITDFACLMPCAWQMQANFRMEEVTVNEQPYLWSVICWDKLNTETLDFIHSESGEKITCSKKVSEYSASLFLSPPAWVENTSMPICCNINDLREKIRIYHNEQLLPIRDIQMSYTVDRSLTSLKYTKGGLPDGLILFKVTLPDGQIQKFRFYNLNQLCYRHIDDTSFELSWAAGTVRPYNEQHLLTTANKYQITNTNSTSIFTPICFKLCPIGKYHTLDINITSPKQANDFIDSTNQILENNYPIAITDLYKYKLFTSRQQTLKIALFEENYATQTTPIIIRKTIYNIPSGKYSLDYYKDIINKFFAISGFNDWRYFVEMKVLNKTIRIYRYNYHTEEASHEVYGLGIQITKQSKSVRDLHLKAIAIDPPRESILYHDEIDLQEAPDRPGFYYITPSSETFDYLYIIFSVDTEAQIQPYVLNLCKKMDVETRNKNKRESIEAIKNTLEGIGCTEEETRNIWSDVWFHMDLAKRYHLSYNTFNCFVAIQSSPNLMAEFCTQLASSNLSVAYDESSLLEELIRFEEDLGVSFHYVPQQSWHKAKLSLSRQYQKIRRILLTGKEEEEAFIQEKFEFLYRLLVIQFGETEGAALYNSFLFGISYRPDPGRKFETDRNYYLQRVNQSIKGIDSLSTPTGLFFSGINYHPFSPFSQIQGDVIKKLQYMALILPQCAVLYATGKFPNIWEYSDTNLFIRRMLNYMRIYANDVYNDIFLTAFSQNNNNTSL